jgi:hypothetical protein
MQLPPPELLRAGLRRWRDSRGWTAHIVAQRSKQHSKNPFVRRQVNKWESGDSRLDYATLVNDILPAYQIEDFDTFVDYCRQPSLNDVVVIQASEFGHNPMAPGTVSHAVARAFLKEHRTRIDRVTFAAGAPESTSWAPHLGHEFVLVLKGTIKCEFAVGEFDDRREVTLTDGMAVVFNSALFHRFSNGDNSRDAEIVVAKPTHAGTAADKH